MDLAALAADDPWVAWDFCEERGWFLPPAFVHTSRYTCSSSRTRACAFSFTGNLALTEGQTLAHGQSYHPFRRRQSWTSMR